MKAYKMRKQGNTWCS